MKTAIRTGAVALLLIASGGLAFKSFLSDYKAEVEELTPIAGAPIPRIDNKPEQDGDAQARVRRDLEVQGMRVRSGSVADPLTAADFASLKSRALNGDDAAVVTLHVAIGACASSLAKSPIDLEATKRALTDAGATFEAVKKIDLAAESVRTQCAGIPQWMVSDLDSIYLQAARAGGMSAAYYLYDKYKSTGKDPRVPEHAVGGQMLALVGQALETHALAGNGQAAIMLADGIAQNDFRSTLPVYGLRYIAEAASRAKEPTGADLFNRYNLQKLEREMTQGELKEARREAADLLNTCCPEFVSPALGG